MSRYYVLGEDGRTPVRVDSVTEWARRFSEDDRRVAFDRIDDVEVSTVFLGIDHSFGSGPPLLFETLVFGGDLDGEMFRYTTYRDALDGHAAMVRAVADQIRFDPNRVPDEENRGLNKFPPGKIRIVRFRREKRDDGK